MKPVSRFDAVRGSRSKAAALPLLFVLASAVGAACSDDAADDASGMTEHPGNGPLYLATARVWDDTTTTSYLHLATSLDAAEQIDPSQGIELPGPAKLFSFGDNMWFAVGSGEEPTITRYTLDERGRLVKGLAITLQPYGVTGLWDTLYFVSPEKAYYPDTDNSQLIRWNPTTMEVTGTIALPETAREGFLSYYSLSSLKRGDSLFFSVGWFDWNETDSILPSTGLVELDTVSDSVKAFTVDERCGGVTQATETASGDAYFVSSALAGATYRLGRLSTEPCALRLRAGASTFDPEYLTHLKDVTGGALAGEPVPAVGDEIFLRVFNEGMATIDPAAMTWDLTGQSVWTWAKWNVATNQLTQVPGLPASTADTFWFRIDGKIFAGQSAADYSSTTLIDLNAAGGPTNAITTPGFLQNIARVR